MVGSTRNSKKPPLRGQWVGRLLTRISELEKAHDDARGDRDALLEATRALRESEERYALAMRGPNEGLWDWDPVTKELFLSARLLAILGFPGETLRTTSHEWLKLVHPDDRQHYQTTLVSHLKGFTPHFECEYRVSDGEGEYRWMLARGLALFDGQGRAYRMVGSIGDVTERKRREQVLKASEARFRSLVGAAASVIMLLDGEGIIVEFNREAERVFGLPRAQAVGCPWSAVLGESGTSFGTLIDMALSGGQVRDREITLAEPPCVLSWNLARCEDGAGGHHVIAIGNDITARRNAEWALQEANEFLERRVEERTCEAENARRQAELANRSKSEFLANMSHELRTPLNAIIGFSDVMRSGVMGPVENPRYAEYVAAIWESGLHLLDIINDVLDLAKVEAGKQELHPETGPVEPLIRAALRLVTERAQRGGIEIEADLAPDLPEVTLDPLRFKQVLLNLLSNAVKFTPESGRVALQAWVEQDCLMVTVADSGIGMNAEEIDHALQPFAQLDSALSRRYAGTGLGLPLAKSFVELHGGALWIHSVPGAGTTVTVTLPVR